MSNESVFTIQTPSCTRPQAHKRNCKNARSAVIDNSSGSEEDPFKDGDNDKDVDYVPSPKKKCVSVNTNKNPNRSKLGKKLTPRQRIERLNRKFSMNKRNSDIAIPIVSIDSIESETHMIPNDDDVQIVEPVTFENHDDLFDKVQTFDNNIESQVNTENIEHVSPEGKELAPQNERFDATSEHNDKILETVLNMQSQVTDLTGIVTLLRKQLSRIEMKTMPLSHNVTLSSRVSGDLESLDDFEGSLAREGFPLKTCVEIIEFEKKLANDSEYRSKLVSLCNSHSHSHLFMLFSKKRKIHHTGIATEHN